MDCFFVLSGFLIGSILLRSIDTSGTQQIRRFYIRRIFRTFPSYYIVLTLLVVCFPLTQAQRAHLGYEYAYLTNFGPIARNQVVMLWGWSLSLEEQFYLFVPLLFVILRRLSDDRARIAFLAALCLCALLVRAFVLWRGWPWQGVGYYQAAYFRTYTRFDTLVAGVMLAVIEARYGQRVATWLESPAHRAMLAVPSLGCVWLLLFPDLFGEDARPFVNMFRWGTLTSFLWLSVVMILLHGGGPITRALSLPIWRRLATLGYGVYLMHIPILDHVLVPLAQRAVRAGWTLEVIWPTTFVLTVILAFATGYVMHILIEKPALRAREWLAA
jgi:peptidoglycan/LPS O-acetylase OafA/YrhL